MKCLFYYDNQITCCLYIIIKEINAKRSKLDINSQSEQQIHETFIYYYIDLVHKNTFYQNGLFLEITINLLVEGNRSS